MPATFDILYAPEGEFLPRWEPDVVDIDIELPPRAIRFFEPPL